MSTLQELKSDLFRALAHPTRIRILERLVPGPQSVQDLIDSIREPEGVGPAVEIEAAPEH